MAPSLRHRRPENAAIVADWCRNPAAREQKIYCGSVRDSRLVQTAVIGNEHSDVPVVLPTQAIELDGFRRVHRHDTFWCGLLLGGCGARLADKLYTDRACHFQHYPHGQGSAPICRRRGIGESSADHLYVKRALETSLEGHGRAARFSYPDPLGSLLDIDLDDGRRLRVHLDAQIRPAWDGGTPILAAGVPLEPGTLSRCRYVYRVRLESDGADRRVWIGTESLAHRTEWTPLANCGWGADGLITEAATRILTERPAPPAAAPSRTLPEPATRLIRGLETAQRSGTVEHVRRLCDGAVPFLDELEPAARAEAEEALVEARAWLESHASYQQGVFEALERSVREGRTWDARAQLTQALTLTRKGASEAERQVLDRARRYLREKNQVPTTAPLHRAAPLLVAQPRRPRPRMTASSLLEQQAEREYRAQLAAAERVRRLMRYLERRQFTALQREAKMGELRRAIEASGNALSLSELRQARAMVQGKSRREVPPAPGAAAPVRDKAHEQASRHRPEALPESVLRSAAAAVRGALKRTARQQGTVTWDKLCDQLGSALPRMSQADRQRVLIQVDAAAAPDEPLLSSVLAAGDPAMVEAYRLSANAQGLELPSDDRELLRDVIDADLRQAHEYWWGR
ncbi:hypothetical protein [Streptomyces sp. NPDC016845]|uniref:hypothetical protein n=1 Tax=Streptomyces sp. NPDC016845 TaxID=3364972 RepID=UPI0037A34589